MKEDIPLKELIDKTKSGDEEACNLLIGKFTPLIKKYSRWLSYDDAFSDLVLWIINVISREK